MNLKAVRYADGVYTWRCPVGDAHREAMFRRSVRRAALICGFLALIALPMQRDGTCVLLSAFSACFFLFVLGVSWIVRHSPCGEFVPYEMTDEYIRIGTGRESVLVCFSRILRAEAEEDRIVLHTRFTKIPVYVPAADLDGIRELISRCIGEQGKFRG